MQLKYIFTIILAVVLYQGAKAQSSVMYHMKGLPQTKELNPALFNKTEAFYIGMPGLSGIDMSVNTNGWSIKDALSKGTGVQADSLVLDLDNLYSALKDDNFLNETVNLTLLEFGFRTGKEFYGFSLSERQFSYMMFSKNLIAPFTNHRDAPYFGEDYATGNFGISGVGYHQAAFNYGREINEKLSIGVAAKAIFAYAGVDASDLSVEMISRDNGYALDILGKGDVNFSVPGRVTYKDGLLDRIDTEDEDIIEALSSTKNSGMAFDFGASYKLNDKFSFSASLIDIGKIKFKENAHNLSQNDEGYVFTGFDVNSEADNLEDEITDAFEFSGKEGDFSLSIPTRMYLSAAYSLNDNVQFGALSHTRFINGVSSTNYTASSNFYIKKFLSLTGSYSFNMHSANKLGAGMAVRMGALQFYSAIDDITPSRSSSTTFRFGINFLFNRKFMQKRKEKLELENAEQIIDDELTMLY